MTAIFLRAGAVGGMLTPALATGAAMGSLVALSINTWTPVHVSVPAVALSCAAGVLAITQGAPIWAALFVWELAARRCGCSWCSWPARAPPISSTPPSSGAAPGVARARLGVTAPS